MNSGKYSHPTAMENGLNCILCKANGYVKQNKRNTNKIEGQTSKASSSVLKEEGQLFGKLINEYTSQAYLYTSKADLYE